MNCCMWSEKEDDYYQDREQRKRNGKPTLLTERRIKRDHT